MRRPKSCRWGGAGCDERAGFGTFKAFCEPHSRRLAMVDITSPVRASAKRRAAKAATASTEPDAIGRLPLSMRAAALGRHVQAASEPVRQAEAAAALGLSSTTGSLPRIVKEARALGYVAPAYGRGTGGGYRPGVVPAPAAPAEPEAPVAVAPEAA